jgi:DNA-binding Lrp family transcriptional regulator
MSKVKTSAPAAVRALIEVSITPQKDLGFDSIAERIYSYPEVKSCYLLSGGYDLLVIVEGDSIHTVADFVAAKLSSMANVRQTATHFLLRKYKEEGQVFKHSKKDTRPNIS